MERLRKLLFELASAERMSVMLELQKNNLKLSQLSGKLGLTVTETSRHLQRLNDAKLVEKDSAGRYELTQFGVLSLCLLAGFDFVTAHRDYFLDHEISGIPVQFIQRFGELKNGRYMAGTLRNLAEGEKNIREAQELTWILSDEVLANTIPVLTEKIKQPFDLRIVLPEGKFPPESISRLPLALGIKKRVLEGVKVLIVITEKYSVFCLPNKNAKFDYIGFASDDLEFQNWCRELFLYYWAKSKPIIN
jgi:predicted transcriptional regulator